MSSQTSRLSADDVVSPSNSRRRVDALCWAAIATAALFIGLYRVSDSGPQWRPDDSKYANDAAMCRDWLLSGDWRHPVEFAQRNYVQYPVHAVPYHPPAYPLMLGIWFTLVGMSPTSARCFVALCLAATGCVFHNIVRRQQLRRSAALACSLLMITAPEVARWSRTTMSEIPSMMFILAGTYCFVRWVDGGRLWWGWTAFAWAGLAFFCRLLTAGLLPAWFLYLLARREYRRLVSPHLLCPATVYLAVSIAWVKFVRPLASHEMRNIYQGNFLTWDNLTVWIRALPQMVGWLPLVMAVVGIVACVRRPNMRNFVCFWSACFFSYYIFQITQAAHFEARYFLLVLPAVCALSMTWTVDASLLRRLWPVFTLFVTLALLFNLRSLSLRAATGKVDGLDRLADTLAQLDEPGNLLLASGSYDCELVFHYRCHNPRRERQVIRGDRTLWLMVAESSGLPSQPIASTPEDVIEIVQRGRVGFLVTSPAPPSNYLSHVSTVEKSALALTHRTCTSRPDRFMLISRLKLDLDVRGHQDVFVWRVLGEISESPSELPIVIPSGGLRFKPTDMLQTTEPGPSTSPP